MTLTELKTLIQNYVENDETTFVATLNDMIEIAEERLFEFIQFDFFRKNVTGNLTTGNTYLTAPADFKMSFSNVSTDTVTDIETGGTTNTTLTVSPNHTVDARDYYIIKVDYTATSDEIRGAKVTLEKV